MKLFINYLLLLVCVFTISCKSRKVMFTQQEILNHLDSCGGWENPYRFYMDLNDGYLSISSNKIYLFADKTRWAIVFEKNGFSVNDYLIEKDIQFYGNCLINLDKAGLDNRYFCNSKRIVLS